MGILTAWALKLKSRLKARESNPKGDLEHVSTDNIKVDKPGKNYIRTIAPAHIASVYELLQLLTQAKDLYQQIATTHAECQRYAQQNQNIIPTPYADGVKQLEQEEAAMTLRGVPVH